MVLSITLSMIVRDEEPRIATVIKSIRDYVSEMVIVDTGSTDNTAEIARSLGATVSDYVWHDDFGAARQHALGLVKTPWTIWLDADDLALNPQVLEADCEFARRKGLKGLWCRYQQDETSYQRRLSIFKTDAFRWEGFVHENPIPKRPYTETMYSSFTIKHNKPADRRPEAALKYLKILQDKDPTNWFGIAESYRFLSVHPDNPVDAPLYRRNAEELFYRAAQAPGVDMATKFISLLYCGKLNLEIAGEDRDVQRLNHAINLLRLCHSVDPERAEPITLLGTAYEAIGEHVRAIECYEQALRCPMHERVGLVLKDYYRAIPAQRIERINAKTENKVGAA